MAQRYGIGFIGLGSIGQRMLARAWDHQRIKPTVVWDPQIERLSQTVANAPELRAAKDVNHLIKDGAVDIVYIASPPLTHAEHANAVLAAGKPVLCEKPLGIDIVTSEALATHAATSGIAHAINFIYGSAYPAVQMAEALAQSRFGKLKAAQVQLHLPNWAARRYAEAPWLTASDQGGFVREVLSHFVYLTERLLFTLSRRLVTWKRHHRACSRTFLWRSHRQHSRQHARYWARCVRLHALGRRLFVPCT